MYWQEVVDVEQAWAVEGIADIAIVKMITVLHGVRQKTSVMKRWSPHPIMASTIIEARPSSCAG
jgi:hypothetical protein